MPEFYTKAVKLLPGFTYAIGGDRAGYTSALFPNGASALDAFNAFMSMGTALTPTSPLTAVFANDTKGVTFTMLPYTIYPFRLRVLGIPAGAQPIIGLV